MNTNHTPNTTQISRRKFLEQSVALGAAATLPLHVLAADAPATTAPPASIRRPSDVIELGPTKVKVSRMGIGTGTYGAGHSSNQIRALGVDGVADMLTAGYEKGLFLWDTADAYGTHEAVKAALKKVPRDKVTIVTKTDAWTSDKTQEDIDRFLKELGTDYIDILLLHTRLRDNWDELDKGAMDVMAAAKKKGILRAVGMSCHSVGAMKTATKCDWLDVCMARLNPAGERMDAEPEIVLPAVLDMRAKGKGIIGIKVLGEGTLVEDRLDEALKYALTKNALHCFSLGCESTAQVLDNYKRIEKLAVPV